MAICNLLFFVNGVIEIHQVLLRGNDVGKVKNDYCRISSLLQACLASRLLRHE